MRSRTVYSYFNYIFLIIKYTVKKFLISWKEYFKSEFHLTAVDTKSILPDPILTAILTL
jgi:hypothetical protein